MARFVEVVFPLPLSETFTYNLPTESGSVEVGSRILAPFGHRTLTGYVVDLPKEAGEIKTKSINAVLDDEPILNKELILLAKRMSAQYGVSLGQAITTILPPGLTRQTRRKVIALDRTDEPSDKTLRELLERIRKGKGLDFVTAVRKKPEMALQFRMLEKGGWVKVETLLQPERAKAVQRKKIKTVDSTLGNAPAVTLNEEQNRVLKDLKSALHRSEFSTHLLHGITGSGKTEIYLQLSAEVLQSGKSVLALVPEIALTPQFVGRFQSRFGDQVSVLHSGRTENERLEAWKKIRRRESKIVIGARSAIFSPLTEVGLVIVDEEHDASYKQDEGLLYNAKELAHWRAESEGALFLLGSATPSMETYFSTQTSEIQLLELTQRASGQTLANVELVDLRKTHTVSGNKSLFSETLLSAISETIGKNEQTVLFLNRRGFAPSVLCPTCGESLRCDHCSVSMTLHERDGILLCHYCGRSTSQNAPCGKCGQAKLIPLGIGTERIEKELAYHFPDARVIRMDRDSVRKRGEHEKILATLARGEADILIGTQMVTKGLDLPNVTMVGVLMADQALHIPDFRSGERTFQLLTQVIGRSGRAKKKGAAIVQTFQPEHYAVAAAARQNFNEFYEKEIHYRKESYYPPFCSLSLIEIVGPERGVAQRAAMWIGMQARKHTPKSIDFLGPAPAPIERIEGKTRFHFIVRSPKGPASANYARWLTEQARSALLQQDIELTLDIDPYRFV